MTTFTEIETESTNHEQYFNNGKEMRWVGFSARALAGAREAGWLALLIIARKNNNRLPEDVIYFTWKELRNIDLNKFKFQNVEAMRNLTRFAEELTFALKDLKIIP